MIFWLGFVLHITIAYPIVYFSSPEMVSIIMYRPVTRWLLFCLKYITNIRYEIKNQNKIPNTQVIIGCNHQSTWETFIFSILINNLAIVVKKELLKKPIAGLYFKRLECIPVDRSSPITAIKTIIKFGKIAFEKGKSILIFPNGTRASNEEEGEYKSGIFALYKTLKIPVVPAKLNSGTHWPRNSFIKTPGTITLEFKDPILPGLNKEEFFKEFAKRIIVN
jgi:1-acyl-sn-glycerol-3-phosphate acyltransferase